METISRREALRKIYRAIVVAGAASFISFDDLLAAEATRDKRLNLIWMHGSSCSGCSCSLLNIEHVSVLDILTKFTNLVFHPDISLAAGDQVVNIIDRLIASGQPYVFVLEGAIPVKMPHACLLAEKPMTYWVERLAAKATACIAAGTCATMGGVTRMVGMEAVGSATLQEFMAQKRIVKPLVNLPNCPLKPDHFVYTLLHYATKGSFPALDKSLRPLKYFADTVHDRCNLYADFQEKRYAKFIGDPGCLLKLGCQGPVTRNDCMVNGHNGNTNSCIKAGHPCVGCTSEHFPRQIMFHGYDDKRAIYKTFIKS